MPAERLRPQDATLWCAQARDAPLQIGALCLFEGAPLRDAGGTLRIEDLRRHIESRLDVNPRARRLLVSVPFAEAPMWVDDPSFDIAHHVHAAALPRPGGDAELRDLLRRLLETPLDERRPLWEMWVVDGLAGDRVAVVPKVSHAMADGMAVMEMAFAALDFEPRAAADEKPAEWTPEPPPNAGALLAREVAGRARFGADVVRGVVGSLARPDRLVRRAAQLRRIATTAAGLAPPLSITSPVGAHRDFAWLRLSFDDLVRVKRACQVTFNDVVLSVVAGALRHYLEARNEPLDVQPRALVPVSTHAVAGEEIENRFSMMITDLPVGVADPVERLAEIHVSMEQHKASSQAAIGPMLFTIGGLLPPALLRRVGPAILSHQPFVNLAVTDLPGTTVPLYLLGSRMLELFPFVCVTGNIALIVGALSYGDGLGVGITVDADVIPDVDVLVEGVDLAAAELVKAVGPAE